MITVPINSRFQDLTGQRFGRLRVLQYAGTKGKRPRHHWLCRCKCRNDKIVSAGNLVSGNSQSCGCVKRAELVGQRFGRLLVVAFAKTKKYSRCAHAQWACHCNCGSKTVVTSGALLTGRIVSCGCYQRDRAREVHTTHGLSGTSAYKRWCHDRYYGKARIMDAGWVPQMEEALYEQQPACVLCGSEDHLSVDHVRPLSRGHGLYPGNAVILCRSCNSTKHDKHPNDLPTKTRTKLLKAAKAFETYWQS